MKKFTLFLINLVVLALCSSSAFAASATFYAKVTAKSTGSGSVYVSKASTSDPAYAETAEATNSGSVSLGSSVNVSFYRYAQPADGCRFVGWYNDEACTDLYSSVATGQFTVKANSRDEAAPTEKTFYAKFAEIVFTEAGKYDITANVTLAEGVTIDMIPEAFKKYVGTYSTSATLIGEDYKFTIWENAEDGIFNNFEVNKDVVAIAANQSVVLNGRVFNIRTIDDQASGRLTITAEEGGYKMDAATVWYDGRKIAIVDDIRFSKTTAVSAAKAQKKAAKAQKFFKDGKIVISKDGKKYNAAGQEM